MAILVAGLWVGANGQVPVQHREGLAHGFLTLRSLDGKLVADGDLIQDVHGDKVTSRLVFHFKDGSLHDEEAVFSQRGTFRLLSDHLVQKGPAFAHPVDMTLNGTSGKVTVRYSEDGKDKSADDTVKTANLSNGYLLVLLKNLSPKSRESRFAMVVPTPKPKLVTLVVRPEGKEKFATGDMAREAMHFSVHVDLGGVTGALAGLLGKQPPDMQVWILEGEAPAFVKLEGPLAPGSPVWRIELASPTWSKGDAK